MEEMPAGKIGSRKRSPFSGKAHILLGVALSAIVYVAKHPSVLRPLPAELELVLGLAAVFGLWWGLDSPSLRLTAHRLMVRGRRMGAPDALEVMSTDPRPPILYFRSFKADGAPDRTWFGQLDPEVERWTFEQRLARAFRRLGPFVALGNPSEEHPHLGAARLYVQNEDWRKTIAQLIQKAQLVVLQVGGSAGLLWEVHETTKAIDPRRVLLALPRNELNGDVVDHETYRQFRDATATVFPVPLPDVPDNAMFLAFDHAWRPRFFVPEKHGGRASDHAFATRDASPELHTQARAWDGLRNEFRAQPAEPEGPSRAKSMFSLERSDPRPTDTASLVTESRQCPHCKSPNPAGAVRCNCGWVFQGGFLGPSASARAADISGPEDRYRRSHTFVPAAVFLLGAIALVMVSDGRNLVTRLLGDLAIVGLVVLAARLVKKL